MINHQRVGIHGIPVITRGASASTNPSGANRSLGNAQNDGFVFFFHQEITYKWVKSSEIDDIHIIIHIYIYIYIYI